jgi:hypothetical protein
LRELRRIRRTVELRNEAFRQGARTARERQEYVAEHRRQARPGRDELLEQLRRRLIAMFPNAVSVYNNPFARLFSFSERELRFLLKAPRRVIEGAIRKKTGEDFSDYMHEQGLPFGFGHGMNPLHYHEDASNYGI